MIMQTALSTLQLTIMIPVSTGLMTAYVVAPQVESGNTKWLKLVGYSYWKVTLTIFFRYLKIPSHSGGKVFRRSKVCYGRLSVSASQLTSWISRARQSAALEHDVSGWSCCKESAHWNLRNRISFRRFYERMTYGNRVFLLVHIHCIQSPS